MSGEVDRLYFETPLVESLVMSQEVGLPIFLKMENVHPAGSYKMRGISHLCQEASRKGCETFVSSSGGNAGLAVAFSARKLGKKCYVVVPKITPEAVIGKLELQGAQVEVYGQYWNQSNERAIELAKQPGCFYIHPFDNPTVWDGHSTMIKEVARMDPFRSQKPSLVVVSIGGGGLACGALQGMGEVGWQDVPLLAMETVGADCFNQSVNAGRKITTAGITSVAVALGSTVVCDRLMDYLKERRIFSKVVTDDMAVHACFRFLDEQRAMVDAACGAALAAAYSGIIKDLRQKQEISDGPVLIIACGGTMVSFDTLMAWKTRFNIP